MKKKILVLSILCLLFLTVSYTYSAFRNTIEGNISATSSKWNFKMSISSGTKEDGYYKVPITKKSGAFSIVLDNTNTRYGASYIVELEPVDLPDDIVINDLRYEGTLTNDKKTISVSYSSSSVPSGYIKVSSEARIFIPDVTVMKNGYSKSTEFWNSSYKSYVRTITFNNDLSNMPTNCTEENLCFDITIVESEKNVYGYLVDSGFKDSSDSSKTLYDLYIVSENEIFAPISCESLLYGFRNLVSIDFSNFNTSNVTYMGNMFNGCSSLTSLNLSGFDTSNVTYMDSMFNNCSSLTSLDLSGFDTSNVIYMNSMFNNCSSLTSLNLSGFDTSNVTYMGYMFVACSSLTSLDLSGFDTSNVTIMASMFGACSSLTSLDLSGFDTSNVTYMGNMFDACSSLTSLDLSGFDTSKVIDMYCMFIACSSLTSLDLSSFDTSNVTNMGGMFALCSSLEKLDLSGFDTSSLNNILTLPSDLNELYLDNFIFSQGCFTSNNKSFLQASNIKKISLKKADFSKITSLSGMFEGMKTEEIDLSNADVHNITDMSLMFASCGSLKSLDLSGLDTSNVTNMFRMFHFCSSLTNLDLNGFDTSNVTNMSIMFYNCSSLKDLDLSSFDTSNVTDMSAMFLNCSSLITTIIIANPTLTNYGSMFSNAATKDSAQITVNYVEGTSDLVDNMIATKSDTSNVVKGNTSGVPLVVQSAHYPYSPSNIQVEKTFEGASSLTVLIDYETNYEYIYIYDSTSGSSIDYFYGYDTYYENGKPLTKKKTVTKTIDNNYIKISFSSYSYDTNYYGFRAVIIPNYEDQE